MGEKVSLDPNEMSDFAKAKAIERGQQMAETAPMREAAAKQYDKAVEEGRTDTTNTERTDGQEIIDSVPGM